MANWEKREIVEPLQRYHEIYCTTCIKSVPSKKALLQHMGHDVHYRDEKGNLDA